VLKLNNKISKLSVYLILLGYLTITTANVFHHHNIDLGKSISIINPSVNQQNSHIKLLGSEVFCVVHFAYNSLHNSVVSFNSLTHNCQNKPVIVELNSDSSKPTKETIFSFCLRAPPFSIS